MKRYYVCSPLHDDNPIKMACNQLRAKGLCEEVEEKYKCRAVAPHAWLPFMLDDKDARDRELAINFGTQLLLLCDALVICGNIITEGMAKEIAVARKNNIEVIKYKGE